LENLKKQAKSLLRAHQQGDQTVCTVLRHLHRFTSASPDEILSADVTLTEMQFALAQDYGFTSWRALKQYVEQEDPRRYLHVFCIELPALVLRESRVPGTVMTWLDPLIEGPTPSGVTEQQWLELRAQQLTEIFPTPAQAIQALQNMDRRLAEFPEYQEVVLWFDACLYDQVVLCRQLDWFSRQTLGRTTLSLICIGEYPGKPVFHGLGELSNEQLAGLLPQRQPVSAVQTTLGVAAWQAYRSADPTSIEHVLAGDTSALPYLAPALLKHLERFPTLLNGVNRMEQEILELVANGYHRYDQIFHRLSDLEQPAYFGLSYLFDQLEPLASREYPLLTISGLEHAHDLPRCDWPITQTTYTLTSDGEAVMRGQADWITLNGIDRWLGGVHLYGTQAEWRWDNQQRKLVRMV
jgi:hypothetical protein